LLDLSHEKSIWYGKQEVKTYILIKELKMSKYLLLMLFGLQAYGAGSMSPPETDVASSAVKAVTAAEVAAMGKDSERYKMGWPIIRNETANTEIYGKRRSHSAGRMESTGSRDRAHGVAEMYCARGGAREFARNVFTVRVKEEDKNLRLRKALADQKRKVVYFMKNKNKRQ
jgi:hypothetical protein